MRANKGRWVRWAAAAIAAFSTGAALAAPLVAVTTSSALSDELGAAVTATATESDSSTNGYEWG